MGHVAYFVIFGPEFIETEPGTTPRRLDEGGITKSCHDGINGILNREDKAGGEAAIMGVGGTSVDQGGGVGEEIERREEAIKGIGPIKSQFGINLGTSNRSGHSPEKLVWGLVRL